MTTQATIPTAETPETDAPAGEIRYIALDLIDPGPNDRTVFVDAPLVTLGRSIAVNGLAQPVTVRPMGERFELVAGERRTRATRLIGNHPELAEFAPRSTIKAIVRAMGDREAADVMLAENLARQDLNPIDEARAFQSRKDRFGMSNAEVAAAAGVSVQKVFTRVRLLRLVDEAQHLVAIGQLPGDQAQLMADLDANRQRLALAAIGHGIDRQAFRALIDRLTAEQSAESMFDADSFLQVDTYIADAAASAKLTKPEQMRRVIRQLLDVAGDAAPAALRESAQALLTR